MMRQVGSALHFERLRDAVIGPSIEFPRDAAPDLEPEPAHRAQKDRIHAHALLQRGEHRVHAFVHEAGGPDLDAYAPVAHGR